MKTKTHKIDFDTAKLMAEAIDEAYIERKLVENAIYEAIEWHGLESSAAYMIAEELGIEIKEVRK